MKNNENRHIPGTNPEWGFEVPEGYTNSIVDKKGRVVDTGWNFDERDDEEIPAFDPEAAKKAREEAKKDKTED